MGYSGHGERSSLASIPALSVANPAAVTRAIRRRSAVHIQLDGGTAPEGWSASSGARIDAGSRRSQEGTWSKLAGCRGLAGFATGCAGRCQEPPRLESWKVRPPSIPVAQARPCEVPSSSTGDLLGRSNSIAQERLDSLSRGSEAFFADPIDDFLPRLRWALARVPRRRDASRSQAAGNIKRARDRHGPGRPRGRQRRPKDSSTSVLRTRCRVAWPGSSLVVKKSAR